MAVASNTSILTGARSTQRLAWWSDWLSPALILSTPFIHFLKFNGYPFARPEVIGIFAGLLALALAASVLLRLGGARTRVLVYALLVTSFLNLRGVHGFVPWLVGMVGIGWLLRAHLSVVVGAVFAVLLVSTLLLPAGRLPQADDFERTVTPDITLPPVIHLVFDEHIGVGGIPQDVPNGTRVARELRELYERNGFYLAGGAYSQYFKTFDSLSNLLNFNSADRNQHYFPGGKEADSYVLRDNAYFELLAERGYTVRVYQSSYLDFCSSPAVSACFNYPKNSISSIDPHPVPATQKALFILNSYLHAASAQRQIKRNYLDLRSGLGDIGMELPVWRNSYRAGPLALTRTWQRLHDDVLSSPGGTVFFAHLLTPHTPYVLEDDCNVRARVMQWLDRRSDEFMLPRLNSPVTWANHYDLYLRQVSCLGKQLQSFFDELGEAGLLQRAIIILHGDHGSRIAHYDPHIDSAELLSERDIVDHYSTLYAIKAPDVTPGYDSALEPLQNLFARAWGREPFIEREFVYLLDETQGPLHRRPLDRFTSDPP